MKKPKILLVVTSHDKLGDRDEKTGFWLEELAVPYMVFARAGAEMEIASPHGGRPPVEPRSEFDRNNPAPADVQAFLTDPEAQRKLGATTRLDEVEGDYDAVFVAGGHGVMWDLSDSEAMAALLSRIYEAGGVVSAVCHGPAALLNARKPDQTRLVANCRVTGFSNEEEDAISLCEVVPYLLETRLQQMGGRYERGPVWESFAVRDGRLITGQNPASSRAVAEQVLAALAEQASA